MLPIKELLEFITGFNKEIEETIENLCGIEKLSLETDGDMAAIKLSSPMYFSNEDEVLDSITDLQKAILHELKLHKIQVDGMIKILENKVNN